MVKKFWNKYKDMPVQAKAAIWFLVCSFMQRGISTVTTPIFTRLMSTSDYGTFTTFGSWLSILTIFISLRLYYGVYTQGLVKFSEDRLVYSSSMQGLSLTLCSSWLVIYLLFHDFWNGLFGLTTVQMVCMFLMIWSTGAFHFWASEQRVQYKYVKLVTATLIVSIANPIVCIIFVMLSDDKATARIVGLACVEFCGYVGFMIVQMRRGKKFFSARFWKHALMFNLPLIPHYLSQTVLASSDRIMIKRMIGSSEAGIYGLAYTISQVMILFNTALMQTLSPWIYQKIKKKEIGDIAPIAYLSLGFVGFLNLALIAFAPELVAIFAPKTYGDAIWVIPPAAMGVFFMYGYDLIAKFAFYYEKTTQIMMASMTGAALNLLLNYIFIQRYGYVAAGYTTLICYMVYSICHYFIMVRTCRSCCDNVQPYDPKILMVMSAVLLVCGFALMATYNYPLIRYGIIAAGMVMVVVFRKPIIKGFRRVMAVKKK